MTKTATLETPKTDDAKRVFLEQIKIGVSGLTPDAKVLGAKPGYVYRQSHINKVDYNKQRGYEYVDSEKILGPHSGGDDKRHGDTVLMRCSREIVDARDKLREEATAARVRALTHKTARGAGIVGGGVTISGRKE